jgi:hypothetical protein
MKPSPRPPKACSSLSNSLHQLLNAYALAATAAGVGAVPLAQPAAAEIIYVPTHRHITIGHGVSLALNQEGVINFNFSVKRVLTYGSRYVNSFAVSSARPGNSVAGGYGEYIHTNNFASALKAGVQVGTELLFVSKGIFSRIEMAQASSLGCGGSWANVTNRYLGLKFRVRKGPTQYGWARLNVSCKKNEISGILTGYAYETIPNKPIVTGKTKGPDMITIGGSLGRLARGASQP